MYIWISDSKSNIKIGFENENQIWISNLKTKFKFDIDKQKLI